MGCDKALLAHPDGGTWLLRTLNLLAQLHAPVCLLSRHQLHLEIARSHGHTALSEPAPHEGPLLALARLMGHHVDQRLLLCPIDMPQLNLLALHGLLAAAALQPDVIHVAHDGERSQPLLGVYPNTAQQRQHLTWFLSTGERRLQTWLEHQPLQTVPLDPAAIANINHAAELAA